MNHLCMFWAALLEKISTNFDFSLGMASLNFTILDFSHYFGLGMKYFNSDCEFHIKSFQKMEEIFFGPKSGNFQI